MLEKLRPVDLTQPLGPDTVMWPGAPAPSFQTVLTVAHDGFYNRLVSFVEHTSTHFDAPCHMVEGTESVDVIGAERLVRPLAVIDIAAEVGDDADAALSLAQVQAFEARHGRIPDGAAVFLRTGWELRNTDPARYANVGGPLRFPGFGPEAARFLVHERGAAGLGTDTLGIDPGIASDFVVHRQISHPRGVWHVENLTNLAAVPPLGAWVVVAPLRLVDGSGSPCRVIALVP
jgi:kynurenine formamidase